MMKKTLKRRAHKEISKTLFQTKVVASKYALYRYRGSASGDKSSLPRFPNLAILFSRCMALLLRFTAAPVAPAYSY